MGPEARERLRELLGEDVRFDVKQRLRGAVLARFHVLRHVL